jgi:methyltransferase
MALLLAGFVAVILLQRGAELLVSARHARRLLARGAREHGADGFPLIVCVHVLFPLALMGEVLWLGTRPGPWWPLWLCVWLAAQALRYWAVHALGERWNVRVLVLPGVAPERRGPYRWTRHPNYAAVMIEFVAGALLFGAWRTMIAISLINVFALSRRIRLEEHALREAMPRREGWRASRTKAGE